MTPELAHSLDSIFPHIATSRRGVAAAAVIDESKLPISVKRKKVKEVGSSLGLSNVVTSYFKKKSAGFLVVLKAKQINGITTSRNFSSKTSYPTKSCL